MIVKDCFWEKRNLGCSTVEVTIDNNDSFSVADFPLFNDYDYIVVKVPVNRFDINLGLSKLGYTLVELQMEMSIKLKDFDYNNKYLKLFSDDADFQEVTTEKDLDDIISNMSPGMFSTDRICVDSRFGLEIGYQRYVNWLKDEFERKTSVILKMLYKGQNIGFSMFKGEDVVRGLLGGIYLDQQNTGLGVLTPCFLPLYIKRNNMQVKKIVGDISSNNKPVWELYELFGYKAFSPRYVFVKHNN